MNKICTSLEQSNKLIELGIDVSTADMYWWYSGRRYYVESMDDDDFNKESDIPAWSLTALLELMPCNLPLYPEATENGVKEGKYRSSDLIASKEGYLRKRFDGDYEYRYDGIHCVGDYSNPLDAAFEMVCWLLENGKL